VPTVLLDTVLAVTLKKHLKARSASKNKNYPSSKPVVMQKMISTEEWQKKEALRIARDAKNAAIRSAPKGSANCPIAQKKYKQALQANGLSYSQDYYFRNKERIRLKALQNYKSKNPYYKPRSSKSALIKLQQAIIKPE
jgi:hypothetical protein